MNPFSELISKYTLTYNRQMNKFSAPLIHSFGIDQFWYYKITNNGDYTTIGSNLEWNEYYFDQKLYLPNPYLKHPKFFTQGFKFVKNTSNYSYQKLANIGFKVNQSLIFLEKTENSVEGYGFASHLDSAVFQTLCLNEIGLLKLFIKEFKETFHSQLNKISDDSVNIAAILGDSFYKPHLSTSIPSIDKSLMLKQFQLEKIQALTKREKEVLFFVSKGLFAVEIADHLQLSKRTIEHYIENIKNKLDCFTKIELMQKANQFISIGYSLP